MPQSDNLTLDAALKTLKEYSCLETKSAQLPEEKAALRQALLMVAHLADYQNLGICAENREQAFLALASYLNALGYETPADTSQVPEMDGGVYLKFNSKKYSIYIDSYPDKYRGVLVSCQSAANELINATYGHLPLDLFS